MDDPNAHDPTIGDADWDGDDVDYDPGALYGDPEDGAPAREHAPELGRRDYRSYVDQAKQAGSLDELFAQAAERVKKPPTPTSEDDAALDEAVAEATDEALQHGGVCPACGSDNVEEAKGMLVCPDCGMHSPNGPSVWQVVETDGQRQACCSRLCAEVASKRFGGAMLPTPAAWAGDDPGQCYGCGVDIKELLTTDGGS